MLEINLASSTPPTNASNKSINNMPDECFGHPKRAVEDSGAPERPADIMRHGHICSLSADFYFWRSTSIQLSGSCHFHLGHITSHLSTLLLTYTVCSCTVEVEWLISLCRGRVRLTWRVSETETILYVHHSGLEQRKETLALLYLRYIRVTWSTFRCT